MRHIFLLVLGCVMSLSAWAGHIVTDSIQSNILGERVKYNIYLPKGFSFTQAT